MNRKVAVRAIIVNESGKLFAVRLKPYPGSMQLPGEWWCLPGGGLDIGEPLQKGLEREMLEETGIKPVIGELMYIQQFVINNQEQLEFFYHVKNFKDYSNIDLSKTTHGLEEIEEVGFIDAKNKDVRPVFLKEEDLLARVETSLPVKIFNYIK